MADKPVAKKPVSLEARAGAAGLFVQHAKQVYGLALAACQGNKHEAEEMAQETFVSVLRDFERSFKGESAEAQEALVMCIAKRRIIDRFRYHRSRKSDPSDRLDELLPDDGRASDVPAARAEHRQTMDRVWQVASQHLSPTEHRVAFLTWAMDLNDADIARVLGIRKEGTVRSHRSRAAAKIRNHLGEDMIFPGDSPEEMTIKDGEGEQA